MRAAQIEDGLVINVIKVEEADLAAFNAIPCPNEVGPGWGFDGLNWTPPPEPEEPAQPPPEEPV